MKSRTRKNMRVRNQSVTGGSRQAERALLVLSILIILGLLAVSIPSVFGQDDETCAMCHADPDLTEIRQGVPISLHATPEMIEGSVHAGFGCVDCHDALYGVEDFPHEPDVPDVDCSMCHDQAFEEYMEGFYQHLNQRGFTTIPGCTSCHGKHEISGEPDTRKVCGVCHNNAVQDLEESVHGNVMPGQISCTSCHAAHTKSERGEMLPSGWRIEVVNRCMGCHQDNAHGYIESAHYKAIEAGSDKAPICVDCHDYHTIMSVENPESPVNLDNMDATCSQCHRGKEQTVHRKVTADARLMTCAACHTGHETQVVGGAGGAHFEETISQTCNRCHDRAHADMGLAHAEIMAGEEEDPANCMRCHEYHADPEQLDAHRAGGTLVFDCGTCHEKEQDLWQQSVHGQAYRKGHDEAPTCTTCHGSEQIERVSSEFTGQSIISLCASCHADRETMLQFQVNPNVVSGYLNTYHGKAYSLGYQGEEFATCVSCHENHLILPHENPQSTIAQQNLVNTCGRCHEDANVNFAAQLQHYDPMAHEEHPILDAIHVFMVWLLIGTLSIFGAHTILWLFRAGWERIKHGRDIRKHPKVRYKRFNVYDRVLHGIVIVSFLLLASTGLPLKYSYTEISYWIANNIVDLRTMALLHRIGAGMTFAYFALHLGALAYKLAARHLTFKQMFWGPDSLVPQPRDFKEFFQHVGYFLGIAQKPAFGRFAYWEKFDYFAVFWGVAVIGVSGLTLWFPEFFTQFLPGWVINAAAIIHSEEALLATGFIFTIHFFNEHFRPENFPMDEVIFTGTVSRRYMIEERKEWYDRMEREGKLEQMESGAMKTLPRALLYAFGFTALAIGIALLGLIVIGTLTG